ncbi:MAG: hypothetical protein ABL308_11365 [Oceanicaulis sp.]
MTRRYWFAPRRRDGAGQSALIGRVRPVSWQGWACVALFGACMAIGLALWTETAAQGLPRGWVGFAFLTIIGAGVLFAAISAKSDPDHTAADYRAGRVKKTTDGPENA